MGQKTATRSIRRGARKEKATPTPQAFPRWLLPGALSLIIIGAVIAIWFVQQGSRPDGAISTLQTGDFHAFAFSPTDPNQVYFGHHNGVMRSDDGGRTWVSTVSKNNFDAMGLTVNPLDGKQLFLAGHNLFQMSNDSGKTWQAVQHDLPGTDMHGFAVNPAAPLNYYTFIVGSGLFQSKDGGQKWQRFGGVIPMDVMGIAAEGDDTGTFYAVSMQSGLLRSTDGGKSWATVRAFGPAMAYSVAVDPLEPRTVYAGLNTGIQKSVDGGATWRPLPFPAKDVTLLGVSPVQKGVVLAVSVQGSQDNPKGIVYRSEDGGQTW